MASPIILVALLSAVSLSAGERPSSSETPNSTGCTAQIGPRNIDFGDVPVGASQGLPGTSLLALSQDQTATQTISVRLSFDPSPPFFDGFNGGGSSDVLLPPGSVDDHLIRCVPTQLGLVHGTIAVSATNCPAILISLSCNGIEPRPTASPPTPTTSSTPCATPVCHGSPLPPMCILGSCFSYCEATAAPTFTPSSTPTLTPTPTLTLPQAQARGTNGSGDCSVQSIEASSNFPVVGALLLAILAVCKRGIRSQSLRK
jgi:hypothetical protein